MNDLVNEFMKEYVAKVEADGREAAHEHVDAVLLPRLTENMNEEEIKAFQDALAAPVSEYLLSVKEAE